MRLIDADAFIEELEADAEHIESSIARMMHYAIIKDIEHAPTINAVKVGQWEERYIEDDECPWTRRRFYCSHCGKWQTYGRTKFCSSCGAKMEVKK